MIKRWLALAGVMVCVGCGTPKTDEKKMTAQPEASLGTIEKLDPAMDSLIPRTAKIERIATGHDFTEGPMYMRDGYLLFSDIPRNTIYKWVPEGTVSEFRKPSGYDKSDAPAGAFIGSNGLTTDAEGRLIICEHGNGRVTRLEKDGKLTVLADKFEGKRLNSPNDAVYKSDGSLYFTDPPYGFPKLDEDPKKELKFNGVYRLKDSKLTLLTKELTRPNGLGFSPDEKFLYVANSDEKRKIWMKYEVKPDGTLGAGQVFYDATSDTSDGLPDGLKLDKNGNVYATGPGGVWVFSPQGKLLGKIKPLEVPANLHWGKWTDSSTTGAMGPAEPATTLYMTARTSIYRLPVSAVGIRP